MRAIALAALITVVSAVPAAAQQIPAVDFAAGWAGFTDESVIHHGTIGAGVRFPLGNRVSLGPEFVYMAGPGEDRDLFANAAMTVNLRPAGARVMPYVVLSGGAMWHRDEFHWLDDWYRTWNVSGGGGVRARVADRLSLGAEARVGSELELRISGVVAYAIR